jgi:pimeloyl-ACP methyl ester carboxylesterase
MPFIAEFLLGAAALAASALYVGWRAHQADTARPPHGRFVEVDGVRLHYLERGEGVALVLFHGNGSLIREMELSGLVDLAARRYRVILFDRPGFGYSERPGGIEWTPAEQASLLAGALRTLGAGPAIVLGHSWGTLVALAFALGHPAQTRGVVLVSGFYFPTPRPDAFVLAAPSWPVVGPLMRYTTSPLLARLLWPALERIAFGPAPTPKRFRRGIDKWTVLRPSRVGSAARESGMMVREASRLAPRYYQLTMPVAILAGERDHVVSPWHATRLHGMIASSELTVLPGLGHMLHHHASDEVMRAIDRVAQRSA